VARFQSHTENSTLLRRWKVVQQGEQFHPVVEVAAGQLADDVYAVSGRGAEAGFAGA
jgi:hypothetical protein